MTPVTLHLAVQPTNRGYGATAVTKDAKIVNAFLEKNVDTGAIEVFKRPGLVSRGSPGINAFGIYNWNQSIYIAANGHLWQVTGSTTLSFTDLGVIDGSAVRRYQFTECGSGSVDYLYFSDDNGAYLMDGSHVITTPAGANFPANGGTGSSAYLDGTLYVLDRSGNIKGSAIYDPTDWSDVTNSISTLAKNEKAVCIYAISNYIIAFKNFSLDAYWDAGNPTGSPLQLLQGAHQEIGIYNAGESLAKVSIDLYWLGQTKSGAFQVFCMHDLSVNKVSTPPVERLLQFSVSQTIRGYAATFSGKTFYIVSSINDVNPRAGITLVYDTETKLWYQWTWADGTTFPFDDSAIANIVSNDAYFSTSRATYFINRVDGELYYLNPDIYTDDDGQFTVDLVTPNVGADSGVTKTLSRLDLIGDQVSGSIVYMRYSDDDYQTWSEWIAIDMSVPIDFKTNLGSFVKRAFQFRHESDVPMRLTNASLHLEVSEV